MRPEVEGEVEALRRQQKQLATGMSWAIDVLLHDTATRREDGSAAEESARKRRRMEALDCLAYVQDVLNRGAIGGVDEERLLGESEIARREKVIEERAAILSTPITPAQEANVSVPKSDPLGGRPKTMLSSRDSKPSVSLPRTVFRLAPSKPPTTDPLAPSAPTVSPHNTPIPYSANTTLTRAQQPVSHPQTASAGEVHSSLSTSPPVTRGARSAFSSTNMTTSTSLPREGGHHAPRSKISNTLHGHGHRKNRSSEVHVPSTSPPTPAKVSPSGYPPSSNTHPPPLFSPGKPQGAPVAFDPLGALG
jgi:TBC1 domain family protein 5